MQTALVLRTNRLSAPPRVRPYIDMLAHDLADLYAIHSLSNFDRDRFLIASGTPRNRKDSTQ